MNHYALRLFVKSILAEAKDKKVDKEPKKSTNKPEPKKAKKVSGNLVEMKKDLADLKGQLEVIDELITAFSNITPSNYTDVEIIGDAVESAKKEIEKLNKEKESIKKEITSLEENTSSEINKIKEMMGLVPKGKGKDKQKKMVDEKKMTSAQKGKKESMLREGQFIRIKNDFTLDGKNFKKGELIRTAKEFHDIEAAAKSGKIQKSDFAIVVGSA